MSTGLEKISEHTAKWLVNKPRQVAGVLALLVVGSLAALPLLMLESGTRVFVADDDPAQLFLKTIEQQFVSDDVIFVAYQAADVFSKANLEEIRVIGDQFSAAGEGLIDDVVSVSTVKDVRGADSTFRSVLLVPDEVPSETAALEDIRAHARSNWLIRDGLLSATSPNVAAIMVRLARGSNDEARARAVVAVRRVLAEHSGSQMQFFVTGGPVIESDSITCMMLDLKRFVPVTYVMLSLLIFVFTRRVAGVVLAFANASIAVIFGMGTLAVFGSLTNLSTIMPPMLMVLSVATVVHFLTEYARNTKIVGPERAAEVSLKELLVPAFMCELTTAFGFVSFGFSRIPAMREFGIAAAIAVMGVFATSFLMLALVVRYFGAERLISSRGIAASAGVERMVNRYTDLAIRRPKLVLSAMGVLTVISSIGLIWFKIDHSTVDQFTGDLPIRRATEMVNTHLGGSNEIIVSVRTHDENRFLDPAELQKLEALQAFLALEVKATMTASVADHVRLMHRAFNDEIESANHLPQTREQVAQLVLLNGDDRLFQFVDRSWMWARVGARTTESGSAVLTHRFSQIDEYLKSHFPASAGYEARVTGATYLDIVMTNNILDGQTSSFLISFALIFLPMILVFGSLSAAAFTVPSNIFPILACLGLMGWLGIPLDVGTSMTTAIVLGIAVDDTIHFIQSMRQGLAEHQDLERAIRHTMATKGVGALWITLIITLGFGTLMASNFKVTFNFGFITSFAMVAGVLAEVLLLPPLIVLTGTRLGVPRVAASVEPSALAPKEGVTT